MSSFTTSAVSRERVALQWLAGALHDDGHEVGIVGMAPPQVATIMDFAGLPVWQTRTRTFTAGDRGESIRSTAAAVRSPQAARVMRTALREFCPEIVHFHGTCYQLTPSVAAAVARSSSVAVVTAHEYKLICANQ